MINYRTDGTFRHIIIFVISLEQKHYNLRVKKTSDNIRTRRQILAPFNPLFVRRNFMENEKFIDWVKVEEYQARRKRMIEECRTQRRNEAKKWLGEELQESELEFLKRHLEEVEPIDFYEHLFRGYLDIPDAFTKGEYVAIACEKTNQYKSRKDKNGNEVKSPIVKRYSITDGLNELKELINTSENFCFMSPISYCGKTRTKSNARFLFAYAIDVDGLIVRDDGVPCGIRDLFFQIQRYQLPAPSYIVHSGTGVHLYYIFDEPIPLYQRNIKILDVLRKKLVKLIWNQYITEYSSNKEIQWESLYQAFRIAGTRTKFGVNNHANVKAKVFRVMNGDTVSLEYLASFTDYERWSKIKKKPTHTREQLKEKYPDWYERTFTPSGVPRKNPIKKYWTCHQNLYYWYLQQIPKKAKVHHRYYSLMCLAAYALKSGIKKDEFEMDCWKLLDVLEEMTEDDGNHFEKKDVLDAIACYDNPEIRRLSIDAINEMTGFDIQKNKRNKRKRADHLAIARGDLKRKNEELGYNLQGRKDKKREVLLWQLRHPNGKKADCIRDLKLTKPTVYKWWDDTVAKDDQFIKIDFKDETSE